MCWGIATRVYTLPGSGRGPGPHQNRRLDMRGRLKALVCTMGRQAPRTMGRQHAPATATAATTTLRQSDHALVSPGLRGWCLDSQLLTSWREPAAGGRVSSLAFGSLILISLYFRRTGNVQQIHAYEDNNRD